MHKSPIGKPLSPIRPPSPPPAQPLLDTAVVLFVHNVASDTLLSRGEARVRKGGERDIWPLTFTLSSLQRRRVFVRAIVRPSRKERKEGRKKGRSSFSRATERGEERTPRPSFASSSSSSSSPSCLVAALYSSLALWRTEILRGRERVGSALNQDLPIYLPSGRCLKIPSVFTPFPARSGPLTRLRTFERGSQAISPFPSLLYCLYLPLGQKDYPVSG